MIVLLLCWDTPDSCSTARRTDALGAQQMAVVLVNKMRPGLTAEEFATGVYASARAIAVGMTLRAAAVIGMPSG
jgi:hypothetical protein